MSGALRFNAMHFMPYVHLPENHKEYKSLWVNFPNKYYDPEKGHELYQALSRASWCSPTSSASTRSS